MFPTDAMEYPRNLIDPKIELRILYKSAHHISSLNLQSCQLNVTPLLPTCHDILECALAVGISGIGIMKISKTVKFSQNSIRDSRYWALSVA